ncbi:MAG: hypothetical protein ACI81T_002334 [Bacteroidia bacterium]|jgi:hypothetical protein
MKTFLRKIKLSEDVEMELETEQLVFLRGWEELVDFGNPTPLSNVFEAFSSSKNDFVGQIDADSFTLRRRRRLFESNMNVAVAKGNYIQNGGFLQINMEINALSPIFIPLFALITVVYFVAGFFVVASNPESALFILPFLALHASLMLGIPYLFLRRSVKRMKRDLEREFYFMTKQ